MRFIYQDFETYYDKDYSLRKLTPVQYVLDPRFEMILIAVAEGDEDPVIMEHDEYEAWLAEQNLDECVFVTHNALFDMCINAWRYGAIPKLMVDTMSMSRALYYHATGKVSLEAIGAYLGVGVKGKTIHQVSGMRAADIKRAGLWDEFCEYAKEDVRICRAIYKKSRPKFPTEELVINDTVIRCAVQPQFILDTDVLALHLQDVRNKKQALLDRAGITDPGMLRSDEVFAGLLRDLGVEPPTKQSPTNPEITKYAFAKTDHAMIALQEHDDPEVQALVAARVGHKTTLEESRTQRFIDISRLDWGVSEDGSPVPPLMPIPLRYSGAHTHRLSGDWKLNCQNLGRGSKLRDALRAPDGYKVMTVDASQIEARIVAWLAGCAPLVQLFADGADVYSAFASKVYNREINKRDNKLERHVGKTAILGLGYGMGDKRFFKQLISDSYKQGIHLEGVDEEMAKRVVVTYRTTYPEIPKLWDFFGRNMRGLATGENAGTTIGPVVFEKQKLRLPSGLHLFFDELQYNNEKGWHCRYGRETKRLFGGLMTENVVQALARIITMNACVRLRTLLAPHDIWLALQAHDELAYIVADDMVEDVRGMLLTEMRRRPKWATDLPLDAEVGVGQTYGEAK